MISCEQDTIIAQCTPQGKGAIALIRLSGSNVRNIIAKISKLPQGKNILTVQTGTVNFGWVIDKNAKHIDQVMFIVLDAPKTFTGENIIEITCHNNPFIIEEIISNAIANGARLAYEGEFAKRAYLNGKIDLLQAEAINELIHANTQLALKKSLSQLEGSFSNHVMKIENELIRTLAWCDASFEFLDEEEEFGNQIKENLNKLLQFIESLKKAFNSQQQIRQGIRISLIGSVNAGKSSIFNAILGSERAIVADIAGTTRDVIEAGVYRNGNFWTLIDTAGLRQTDDIIEKEGIKRSLEEAEKADTILLVYDGQKFLSNEEINIYNQILNKFRNKVILIKNKSDISKSNTIFDELNPLSFSCKTKENLNKLHCKIEDNIKKLFSEIQSPFLLNKRQHSILISIEKKLETIIKMLDLPLIQYELISYNLKEAIENLSELTGKSVTESALDMVFKEFCVGK